MRITVLGATGGIGRAITLELAGRGHEVTAASRSITAEGLPPSVRILPSDLRHPARATAAAAGAEVVVMAAQVPYSKWASELGPLVTGALAAAAGAGARLVMVDNLYAYGSPGAPIDEAAPEAATTRKGVLRRELGRRLLAAHAEGRARVTIGRFPDYFGPGGTNTVVHQLGVARVLRGKAPQAFVAADQPHASPTCPTPRTPSRGSSNSPTRTGGCGSCPPHRRSPNASCCRSWRASPDWARRWARSRRSCCVPRVCSTPTCGRRGR